MGFYALNVAIYGFATLMLAVNGTDRLMAHRSGGWKDLLFVPVGAAFFWVMLLMLRAEMRSKGEMAE